MKRVIGFILVLILLCVSAFSMLNITVDSTEVIQGTKIPITIKSDSPVVNVSITSGGFDNPKILFEGITLKGGEAKINYIAPFALKTVKLNFASKTEKKELELKVVDSKSEGNPISLKVELVRGPAMFRVKDSDVWESMNKNVQLKEGYEITNPKGAFIKLSGPNQINIDVGENSQIYFEVLKQAGDKLDLRYKIKKGKTYNVINQKLTAGSKFQVSDTNSVVAGVRGTRFGFEIGLTTKIQVFEGVVTSGKDDQIFEIPAGSMFALDQIDTLLNQTLPVEITEDKFTKEIETVSDTKDSDTSVPISGTTGGSTGTSSNNNENLNPVQVQAPQANLNDVQIGTIKKGETPYFIYSLSPELDFGFLKLGIGFSAYQEKIGDRLYYGLPPIDPAAPKNEDIWSAFTLNRLGLDLGVVYFNYGRSTLYTKALGNLMNRYYVPYSKVIDFGARAGDFMQISVHAPYEIRSFAPFQYNQTSQLFFVNPKFNIGGLNLDILGIYDMDKGTKPFDYAVAASAYFNLFGFKLGFEADGLYDLKTSKIGWGALLGGFLDLPPFLQFTVGIGNDGPNFKSQIINTTYDLKKSTINLPAGSDIFNPIILGNLDFKVLDLGTIGAGYRKSLLNNNYDILVGGLSVNLKSISSKIPGTGNMIPDMTIGGSYINRGVDFTKILDTDTILEVYVFYPLIGQNGLRLKYSWDGAKNTFIYEVLFEEK